MNENSPDELRAELRELRPALYHRLHYLLPFVAGRGAGRFWRVLGWATLALYFAFAGLILTLRYSILPNIEQYRVDIEQGASKALGLPVRVGGISAGWAGLQPDLTLTEVTIDDAQGRAALAFSRVEVVLDWSSIVRRQIRLSLLAIDEPVLHIRRNAQGGLVVAGIPVSEGESNAADWVLAQKRIRINGATLVWEDELRGAPPLVLEDLNLAVDNNGSNHRFGLTALPPPELASRIDIRGDLSGSDLALIDQWKGQLFTELDYVDLAGWRPWINYPVALPKGRGAMRGWLTIAEGRLLDVTADLAFSDVHLRLAKDLPELDLVALSGRVSGRLRTGGFAVSAKGLNLGLEDGLQVPPTDLSVDWQASPADGSIQGSATVSRMNLQRLARLSKYLPIDADSRKRLADYSPSGEISDLRLSFTGDAEHVRSYSLRGRFADLGLRANAYFPGFFGISGNVEATDKGGSLVLRSQNSGLDLPSVFPEPRLSFDSLNAQARWKIEGSRIDVDLSKVEFAGHDAAGTAQGTYRFTGDGPGTIDLTAALTRARGSSVWRYMPHAVGETSRKWLRNAISVGNASDAKLILKGNLAHFPFIDGSGTFLVTAKARDVTLNYAPGYPLIEHIDGDLRFAGAGMHIDAQRGTMLGARIGTTTVDIPDFDADAPLLSVRGQAEGPTSEFFRFIEASPVGAMLEHPTAEMKAVGNGKLDLDLEIPLSRFDDSRVKGDFRFIDNQITLDPLLPPMTQVNGVLQFSDSGIQVRDISAKFLGGPVKVRADTRNGLVDVVATGSLSVAPAKRHFQLPIFDSLSGSANWRADLKVKKGAADIVVESTLVGLSSNLPAPFNKSATETLPLRFQKDSVPVVGGRKGETRDRIQFSLGKAANAQLLRRRDASGTLQPEQGMLAVGMPLALPEKGLAVAVSAPEVDVEFWRAALTPAGGAFTATNEGSKDFLPDLVTLNTPSLKVFGRSVHEVDLRAKTAGSVWQVQLASREANGELQFDSFGKGSLRARLKSLSIPTPQRDGAEASVPASALDDLPALDVVADGFSAGDKKLGRLEVVARNEASNWRIEKFSVVNPDGRLDGSGIWRTQPSRRFEMDFNLVTENAGGLLDRLGYAGTLKRGAATLSGKLNWAGVPTSLDYPTLGGSMSVEASRGQFAKMDPGAAGRLLGLISLQGLPRRISLDFQDVFSDGFAFDSIAGKMTVKAGVMHTDRLQIDGPSARVLMRGDVDLENETTKLVVNIQPELGGTAALGVALINPIAGAATLLAHKILQNPLNHVFSFDYGISGKWDDPKVEKLSTRRLDAQAATGGEKRESTQ